jgi:hypothetical protein
MKQTSELRAGEWVEVRSKQEILATLDKQGKLEGLSFMPEMLELCGQRFQVFKRAHKTCDPPNGMDGRHMPRAVHLEDVRCSGSAHGGCQARCLIFWKDVWLKKVDGAKASSAPSAAHTSQNGSRATGSQPLAKGACTEEDVFAGTRGCSQANDPEDPTYVCQSTQLAEATLPIKWWDPRQYLEDYASGNVGLGRILSTFLLFLYSQIVSAGIGLGTPLRWVYDLFHRHGNTYPWREGEIPRGTKTPAAKLDLQPGEWVKVRHQKEILATISEEGNNRGMSFDPEMVPYCGETYQVLARIDRIINEKTGKMAHLKNDCIILDKVVCTACYSKYRRFCPRSIYSYWREIWLERVGTPPAVVRTAEKIHEHREVLSVK